ncbi:hypothetical protein F4561_002228 [Lipingzhangella halophila]|uniref:Uncharacterized protein n=1 Tax=Lipingzhangella halophila TaxID=1783352 RepID=A0A7W7W2F8_9ACTN|nr:hypothetical protein [Lipingzhangella halophila]MBB4931408.1 hypothetical protein [Lipingzhangella halophila]
MTRLNARLARLEATTTTNRAPAPTTTPHCRTHDDTCPTINPRWQRMLDYMRERGTLGDRDQPCDMVDRVVPGEEQLDQVHLTSESGQRHTGNLMFRGGPAGGRNRELPDTPGPEHFHWWLRIEHPTPGGYHVVYDNAAFRVRDKSIGFLPDQKPEANVFIQLLKQRKAALEQDTGGAP